MTDKSPPAQSARRDFGFIAIVAFVAFNAIWLLLMPAVPAVASATLHRFHLRSTSFPIWAIQQPIPSMYNFANWYEVYGSPPVRNELIVGKTEKRYVNHFPVRVFTFANRRVRYLGGGNDCWFRIQSSYRGQTVKSQIHVKAKGDGSFEVIRLSPDDGLQEGKR